MLILGLLFRCWQNYIRSWKGQEDRGGLVVEIETGSGSKSSATAVMLRLPCTCDIALDVEMCQSQHKADTKADTQPDDGRAQPTLKLHKESDN